MIATKGKRTDFTKAYLGIKHLHAKIQNASVKLASTDDRFLGSAVLFLKDDTFAYVLTAKHNIYKAAGRDAAPAWDDALVTAFTANVRIHYDRNMSFRKWPTQQAPISASKPIRLGIETEWQYDTLLLKSSDPGLMTFAETNAVYKSFPTAVVTNAAEYLAAGPKKTPAIFVQTGFGKIREPATGAMVLPVDRRKEDEAGNKPGYLQYRIVKPKARALSTVYNQVGRSTVYEQSLHCIQVDADGNDSSAVGDSGGPLFVAIYEGDSYKLHLIGVNLGADMATAATPCPTGGRLRENNVLTSLEPFYLSGVDILS